MNDVRHEFSQRLAKAMERAGFKARPGELHKVFNSSYGGASVSEMTASRWLSGKAIPAQDKLELLAELFNVDPQTLRFGGKSRMGEGRAEWLAGLAQQDRAMIDGYLTLPATQRKLVRELVSVLAAREG